MAPMELFKSSLSRVERAYRRRPRRWLIASAGAGVTLAAVLAWVLWPTTQAEAPRARPYLEYTACLLTGRDGITDPAAAPVWAGLQDASQATHARIQYLAVVGPQTVDNARTFVNSLAQAGCSLVFAAGDLATAATDRASSDHPGARFHPVGTNLPKPNVTPIAPGPPEQVRTAVRDTLIRAADADA